MSNRSKSIYSQRSILIVLLTVIIILICISYIDENESKNTENEPIISERMGDINNIIEIPGQPQIPGSLHKIISRNRWGGRKSLYERPQNTSVKYVIISHTHGAFCSSITECSQQMTKIQSLHVNAGSPDIGYNFVIGGDANIYVAKGWDNHNSHMNLDTIEISFIGNYSFDQLTPGMIEATQELLAQGVENGKLEKDYILVGHNQTYNKQSPGENVYKQIKFWPHFSSEHLDDIVKHK